MISDYNREPGLVRGYMKELFTLSKRLSASGRADSIDERTAQLSSYLRRYKQSVETQNLFRYIYR